MRNLFLAATLVTTLCLQGSISAHCQMPCGIYHDEMVYDQIDQYAETMIKGVTVMNDNKFSTVQDKNAFVRWVLEKDKESDNIAQLITTYFLQQKIKPGEDDTVKRLTSAHKLLFLLVQIKQNSENKFVHEFADEWEKFKLMFHPEGYECKVEMLKLRKLEQTAHDHDHDHPHDHDHEDDHSH